VSDQPKFPANLQFSVKAIDEDSACHGVEMFFDRRADPLANVGAHDCHLISRNASRKFYRHAKIKTIQKIIRISYLFNDPTLSRGRNAEALQFINDSTFDNCPIPYCFCRELDYVAHDYWHLGLPAASRIAMAGTRGHSPSRLQDGGLS
jgi:hypothetical protein